MKLDRADLALIISALEGDKQGTWGDGRHEKISKVTAKVKQLLKEEE